MSRGFDAVIIVETVGVGQDEVEIARASHTTIVVSAPGLGDEIQAIKAGILEIADIHVVSKCDRSDANRTITDLKQMLMLGWCRPTGRMASAGHRHRARSTGRGPRRTARRDRAAIAHVAVRDRRRGVSAACASPNFRLRKTAENLLLERFGECSIAQSADAARAELMAREADPYSLASELLHRSLSSEENHEQRRVDPRSA